MFSVARAATKDNFYPDIISTDIIAKTLYKAPVYGLPYIMSKYLNMGMSMEAVVAACTKTPAQLMHMENKIGTLKPGAYAYRQGDGGFVCSGDKGGKTLGGPLTFFIENNDYEN